MNMDEIYEQLDSLYGVDQGRALESFLLDKIAEAVESSDTHALVQLLNELIGFYRETGEHEKCVTYCEKLLSIVQSSDLAGTMAHATTILNVANCFRGAGLLKESNALYQQVKAYYDVNVAKDSMLFASLYNNMSLLFQEMGDFESACDCLTRALGISLMYPECKIEQATTYSNLANSLLKLDRIDEAKDALEKAVAIFEEDDDPDYHYSAALSGLAEIAIASKDFESAVTLYEKALAHIERKVGRNTAYKILSQNLESCRVRVNGLSGLELSEKFYNECGKFMIHMKFEGFEDRIAVGLVGEGSECYGFDDVISRDHDFGPGFCMWLTDEDYDEIGEELQKAYDQLPDEFEGVKRIDSGKAAKRTGVFRISDFYKNLIGIGEAPSSDNDWLFIDDYRFAVATNGRIYRDDLGEFTKVREAIAAYYPRRIWVKKIARCATFMSQYGQYNYNRMLGRGDVIAASVALGKFVEETMQMMYLLGRKYAPFYKWMSKGLGTITNLPIVDEIWNKLTDISSLAPADKKISGLIEDICTLVLGQLVKYNLASDGDNYLDNHALEILNSEDGEKIMEQLIDTIVKLEWEAFDKVINEGGRAYCQDDWPTFSIMRKSQYMLWSREMLESFIGDFNEANARGWNIITEKYGRMEISTAPAEYEKIKDSMPFVSEEKKQIVEAIVAIQVGMMEEFARDYPKSACQARSIHTSEDSFYNTSYETYLRGEITTYSDRTLELYGRFVATCAQEGKNIAFMTMENTAHMYGYASIEELEAKLY